MGCRLRTGPILASMIGSMINDTNPTNAMDAPQNTIAPEVDRDTTYRAVDADVLKEDVKHLGQNLKNDTKELVEDAKTFAKSQVIDPTVAKAREQQIHARARAAETEEILRQRAGEAQRAAKTEYDRGVEFVREKPVTAVAIAAVVGAIVGRLLLRR